VFKEERRNEFLSIEYCDLRCSAVSDLVRPSGIVTEWRMICPSIRIERMSFVDRDRRKEYSPAFRLAGEKKSLYPKRNGQVLFIIFLSFNSLAIVATLCPLKTSKFILPAGDFVLELNSWTNQAEANNTITMAASRLFLRILLVI
jgi:hypothetical protein